MNESIKLLEYQNPYWKNNPDYFLKLKSLAQSKRKNIAATLKMTGIRHCDGVEIYRKDLDNRALLSWINNCLQILDGYHLGTKVHWILNGIVNFPTCKMCGREITDVDGGMYGINRIYCSRSCAEKSQEKRLKAKETCLKKYGVDNPTKSIKIKNKIRQNNFKKYGVYSTLNLPSVRAASIEANKRQDIKQKRKNTNIQKYGNPCSLHNIEIHEKTKRTWIRKYGIDNPNKSDVIKQKKKNTNIEKYGVEFSLQSKDVRQKIIKTTIEHYGVEYPLKSEKVKQTLRQTCLEKYGVINGGASFQAHRKMFRKYFYDNQQFDSAPEIALFIWLRDNKIDFEYQPNISFEYKDQKNNSHTYFPDFRIEGFVYEIKGDHFFREDGTMFCPYKKKSMSEEQYASLNQIYEAKHLCMIKNGVIILRNKDYAPYLEYVRDKYGKGFLNSLKDKSKILNQDDCEISDPPFLGNVAAYGKSQFTVCKYGDSTFGVAF